MEGKPKNNRNQFRKVRAQDRAFVDAVAHGQFDAAEKLHDELENSSLAKQDLEEMQRKMRADNDLARPQQPEPPGGKARRGRGKPSSNNNEQQPDTNNDDSSDDGKSTADAVAEFAKNGVKKATDKVVDGAKAAWTKLLAGGPTVWIIATLSIILIIILFVVGLSYMSTISSDKPSITGGTPPQPVKPIEDRELIETLLRLNGDKTVTEKITEEGAKKMTESIEIMKKDATAKNLPNASEIIKQADSALSSLTILQSNNTQENAQKFLDEAKTLFNLIEDVVLLYPIDTTRRTRYPIERANKAFVFNNDLHGFSFLHKEAVPSHNVYVRDSEGGEHCDAVDVGTEINETVYPIFGGTVENVSTDGSDGQKIMIRDGDYVALYAHLKNVTKKKGDPISIEESVGLAKNNNIQIEIVYKEACLVTTHADMIDHASVNGAHDAWGGYLWDRIVNRFSLK